MNKRALKWVGALAGAAIIVLVIRGFVLTSCFIPSTAMSPMLLQGDRIIVGKWSYGLRLPFMSWGGYHRWHEKAVGRQDVVLFNNPGNFKERVIDRRELFISRCVGVPGDTLLVDSAFQPLGREQGSSFRRYLYSYPDSMENRLVQILSRLGLKQNVLLDTTAQTHCRAFNLYEYTRIKACTEGSIALKPAAHAGENRAYPIVVPAKGTAIRVYPWNMMLLRNTLVLHEGRKAEIKNHTLYVDGRRTQHCFFTKDYYWMYSASTSSPSDSRLFGFVPKDHIIGKAWFIWFSKTPGSGPFKGYQRDRFFQSIN